MPAGVQIRGSRALRLVLSNALRIAARCGELIGHEAQRCVGNSQHILCVGHANTDVCSHSRQKFLSAVCRIDHRRICHDVLLLLRVQPDLRYPAGKGIARVSVNREGRGQAFANLADIGLIDQRPTPAYSLHRLRSQKAWELEGLRRPSVRYLRFAISRRRRSAK